MSTFLFYPLFEFLSDIHIRTHLNYCSSINHKCTYHFTSCISEGLRTQTVKFALPQKRPGGRGGGEGAPPGVGGNTTANHSRHLNVFKFKVPPLSPPHHLAPTKNVASLQHSFKVAPKLFLARQFILLAINY